MECEMKKLSAAGLAVLLSLSGGALCSIDEAKAISILEEKASSAASSAVQSATGNAINSAISGAMSGVGNLTAKDEVKQSVTVGELEKISESVQYDEATNTTTFTNIKYVETNAKEDKIANIARVTLVGYKPGQVLKEGDVVEEFTIEGFAGVFSKKDDTNTVTEVNNVNFKRLSAKALVYNISNFTNMFTGTVEPDLNQFSNLHQGFVLEGFSVDDNKGIISTIDKISMPPLVSLEDVSMHISGITMTSKENTPFTMVIATAELNNFNVPLIKKITDISDKNLSQEQSVIEYNKIQELPFKKKIFSNVTFENITFTSQDPNLAQIKNKDITLAKFEVKFDNTNADSLVALFDLTDFNLSSEFLSLADPGLGAMLGASLPPMISIDYSTSYALNRQAKTIDLDSDFNLDKVLNLDTDIKTTYQCASIWDVLLASPQGQACVGVNTVSLALKDLGVGSITAKLAVAMTGIGAENLASFAAGSLQALSMGAKTGVANIDAATSSLTENVIKFIEKPGTLKLMLNFNPPLTMKDLEKGLPENFTYDFKVEQGEKTLQELAI